MVAFDYLDRDRFLVLSKKQIISQSPVKSNDIYLKLLLIDLEGDSHHSSDVFVNSTRVIGSPAAYSC